MPRKGENIYKRKDGRWEGRYIKARSKTGKAVYGYVYAPTYKEAKRKRSQAIINIEANQTTICKVPETTMPTCFIRKLANDWMNSIQSQIKKSSYVKYYNILHTYILPEFDNVPLSELTSSRIQKFCDDLKRVGNVALAMSIEGTEESNDWRRGEGAYNATLKAMELLKKNKCLFGISVCYTRKNDEYVTSDDFIDKMIENGTKFAFYFNYMPVGHGADKELIPTPDQREYMYRWLRKMRNGKTGKPMFVMDFQDDGEYVGGCIAAGRNYFHINSAGDIEPCVFIHYSDTNIRTHTLLEALKSPLFTAYYKGQPFNDNHLRPCPMLENPELLRKIVKESGAHSSDLLNKEDVDELCDKCVDFAKEWAPRAEKLWNSTKHRDTHTQYYRDTEEGKREFGCSGNCALCASHAAEASDSEKKTD